MTLNLFTSCCWEGLDHCVDANQDALIKWFKSGVRLGGEAEEAPGWETGQV